MKNQMGKKFVGAALALTFVAGFSACGMDDVPAPATPQGQVVKSIVVGATVKDGQGAVLIASTLADGKFPLTSAGPYTSTGGTYTDMTGAVRTAPTLVAPAGFANITPMTTLYANATPAVKAQLDTLCKNAGLSLDAISTGSVPTDATQAAFYRLNETLGEVLTEVGSNVTPAYLQALATTVAADVTTIDAGHTTPASLLTDVNAVTLPAGATLDTTKITQIATVTTAGATIPEPPAATGATGSSNGGTNLK